MATFRLHRDNRGGVYALTNDQLFDHYMGILTTEIARLKLEGRSVEDFISVFNHMFRPNEKQTINSFLRTRLHYQGTSEQKLRQLWQLTAGAN